MNEELREAIELVKSAGYRVTKIKPKKDDRLPTYVAHFSDGEVTRMTTYTRLDRLDTARGERLSRAAHYQRKGYDCAIERGWFEIEGNRI